MTIAELRALGFEGSKHIPGTSQYRVRCYSCEALVISGTPCHETGCPEKRVKCRECGCLMPKGEGCDCMQPCDLND